MERLELANWRDMLAAAPAGALEAIGLSGTPFSGGLALRCRELSTRIFNRAFGFGLEAPFGAADLEQIVAHYPEDRGFAILPSPACVFADTEAWLGAHGLQADTVVACCSRTLDDPLPEPRTGLRIADVAPSEVARFAELSAAIFGDPPIWPIVTATVGRPGWRHFVALDEDRPVAVGTLSVRGPDAWLGGGGTLESHRGRGAQSALIAHRLAAARAMGATWARCDTVDEQPDQPNHSFRNVRAAGFTLQYRRTHHVHVPAAATPPAPDA